MTRGGFSLTMILHTSIISLISCALATAPFLTSVVRTVHRLRNHPDLAIATARAGQADPKHLLYCAGAFEHFRKQVEYWRLDVLEARVRNCCVETIAW